MSGYAVGIDLGTTNSCLAVYRNSKVEVIENERGPRITPSWVTFTENQVLTGIESVEEAHKYIKTTIFDLIDKEKRGRAMIGSDEKAREKQINLHLILFSKKAKRLIGQRFNNPKVQDDIKRFPYKVINDLGTPKIKIDEKREYYPEEISGYILRALRGFAEARLNEEITRAVVTVPAYFNEAQRQATKDAATIAGFKTITVINEPTAAAVAFNHQNEKVYKRNILVYDFGGGTFDVSIVSVEKGKCEVRATKGDCHLGGTDIDMNLVTFLKKTLEEKYKKSIDDDLMTSRRFKSKCEQAKEKLSTQYNVDIELDSLAGTDYATFSLSRARFEQLNEELFKRTFTILNESLQDSGLEKDQIDEVILVGGSSKIPKIQDMLIEYFGKNKINKGVNPAEAVAYGAAIYAINLAGDKHEVVDVTSLSLGTNTYGDLMSVIIPRNTPIPAKAIKRYQTIMDNQTSMEFPIYQGEREIASENFELGNFSMTDLSEAPAKAVKVEVSYEIDYEGLLHISAMEINSGNKKKVEIDMKRGGLSEEQIQERIKEAEKNRENDRRRRKFAEEKNMLESVLIELQTHAEKCKPDDRDSLYNEYDSIGKWLDKAKIEDLEKLEMHKHDLKDLINKTPADNI